MSSERASSDPDLEPSGGTRRVQAKVALVLLQALREHDRPSEILVEENVSVTLPRRLGLSGVVDVQIRRYEQEARRNRRISAVELRDLIRLVTRRPDAEEIFRQVGRSLTPELRRTLQRRLLPGRVAFALARRRLASTVRHLFGEPFARPVGPPFQFEASVGPLLEVGSGGYPCLLVTGLAENILGGYREGPHTVIHPSCRGRGDDRCYWTLAEPISADVAEPPNEAAPASPTETAPAPTETAPTAPTEAAPALPPAPPVAPTLELS